MRRQHQDTESLSSWSSRMPPVITDNSLVFREDFIVFRGFCFQLADPFLRCFQFVAQQFGPHNLLAEKQSDTLVGVHVIRP